MEIQTKEIVNFINELVHIPSPSGDTAAAINYMKDFFEKNKNAAPHDESDADTGNVEDNVVQ